MCCSRRSSAGLDGNLGRGLHHLVYRRFAHQCELHVVRQRLYAGFRRQRRRLRAVCCRRGMQRPMASLTPSLSKICRLALTAQASSKARSLPHPASSSPKTTAPTWGGHSGDYSGQPFSSGFNTTPGGSNFLTFPEGFATFTFAAPTNSFGFFLTGVQLTRSPPRSTSNSTTAPPRR